MKKFTSLLLSVLMILSLVPMTVGATEISWSSFVYSQDGPEFSFEASDFIGTGSYNFYAAAYNNNRELLDVKVAPNLAASDGVLKATVDFEDNGTKEADVNISYVKTMVWENDLKPIVESYTFNIEEQYIDPDTGVYNNLTNGFYQQANIAGNAPLGSMYRIYWKDPSKDLNNNLNTRHNESDKKNDSNPSTKSDNTAFIAEMSGGANIQRMQYVTFFKDNMFQIDRLVAYLPTYTDGSFYLMNNSKVSYEAEGYALWFKKDATTTDGIKFVGNRTSENCVSNTQSIINGETIDRLVFNTDYNCRTIVFDGEPGDNFCQAVNEFLPYVKVKYSYSVPVVKKDTVISFDDLTVNQNGPAFTVSGTNFLTNNADLYFTATAYDSENQQIDKIEKPISVTANAAGAISQTADFEEGGKEADLSIDKVVTEIVDGDGVVLATATFDENIKPTTINVNGTNENLTNGFYQQANIAGIAPIGSQYRIIWKNASKGLNTDNSNVRNTESSNKHDSNPTTMSDNKSAIDSSCQRMQYVTFFKDNMFQIDRLVAYLPATTDGSFYLIDNSKVDYNADGYALLFNKDATTTDGIKFVGNRDSANCVSNTRSNIDGWLVDRLVFDTDYFCRTMVFDAEPGNHYSYAINEFLPYVKIKDSAKMVKPN